MRHNYGLWSKRLFLGRCGIFYELETVSKKTTKKKTTLKCLEFELLRKPEIPGIGVEEFVGKYSPKAIIKRAKENRKCG